MTLFFISALLCLAMGGRPVDKRDTIVSFFVEQENEQDDDYIQITLEVKAVQKSLADAIEEAGKATEKIEDLA